MRRRRRRGKDKGRLVILRLENLARRQRVSESWHRHKEPWLSIQLCSTPLWQTCHHRLCLYGSVHHWAPWRKQRMSCNRCDVRDEQLPYCAFLVSFLNHHRLHQQKTCTNLYEVRVSHGRSWFWDNLLSRLIPTQSFWC